jgi:hypothetical protein
LAPAPLSGPNRWVAGFTATTGLLLMTVTALGAAGQLRREALCLAGAAVAAALAWFRPLDSARHRPHPVALLPIALGIVLLVAAEWGPPDPPGTRHYDDTSYHLSTVAHWRTSHDLSTLKFSFGDPSTTFYPLAGELFSWVLLAPFDDSDVLARWAQLPFALASLAAIASIGRRLALSPLACALSACLFLTSPRAFPALALSAGNDHVLSFFVLAGVDAALALAAAPGWGPAALLGTALGAAAGTKYSGLLATATVFLAAALLLRRGSRRWLALSFAVAIAVGGCAYLRNLATAGNPVFPQPVRIAGLELLPGVPGTGLESRRSSDSATLAPAAFPAFVWNRTDLFGPLFRWITLPALAWAWILALRRRRREPWVVLSLPMVWFLLFAFLLHDHRDVRYVFHALALAGLGLGWLVDRFGFATRWGDPPAGPDRRAALPLAATAAASAALLALGTGVYQERKFDRAPASVRQLDALTSPTGATVAYVGSNQPYWFWGRRLQNRVEMVPTRGPLVERHFRSGGTPSFSFHGGSYRVWDRNLRKLAAEYVVVARRDDTPAPVERSWMSRRPEHFELTFADAAAEIWRIRSGP